MSNIFIFGTIGKDVKPVEVAKKLARIDGDFVDVQIHSPGGLVSDGYAIYNILKQSGKEIQTTIVGQCASIATIIALAGKKRRMTRDSKYMIHNPWTGATGDANTLEQRAEELRELESQMAEFYSKHTNIPAQFLREMMNQESEMSAEKALELGFINEILDPLLACAYLPEKEKVNQDNIMNKVEQKFNEILSYLKPNKKGKVTEPQAWELSLDNGQTLVGMNPQNINEPTIGDGVKLKEASAEIEDGEYTVASTRQIVKVESGKISDLRNHVEDVNAEFTEGLKLFAQATGERFQETDRVLEEIKTLIEKGNEGIKAETKALIDSLTAKNESLENELTGLKGLIKSDYTPPKSSDVDTPSGGTYKGSALKSRMREIEKNTSNK